MKNKSFAIFLVSMAVLSTHLKDRDRQVQADEIDNKIASQDKKIESVNLAQAATQVKIDQIQAEISQIKSQQERLNTENADLLATSKHLEIEIVQLSEKIVARNEHLAKQARSAQVSAPASNYINTFLESKSIPDAVSRMTAMNEIVSASNEILEEQKADKEALEEKQVANQTAINHLVENQAQLATDERNLMTKQAELEVARLSLNAELSAVLEEKNALIAQKTAAEARARQLAAEAQAYQIQQMETAQIVTQSAEVASQTVNTATAIQPQERVENPIQTTGFASAGMAATSATNAAAGNTYPAGQCTWGVKVLAPWVGNYWGNGGQWAYSAQAAGFTVGSTPVPGAVAVWNDGGYGHVAYVTAVESPTRIQVSEANYNGIQAIGNYRGWFNPAATNQGAAVYIYPS